MVERRGAHIVLVGKPEGKRPLGIPRHRWEYNIKMDLFTVAFGSTLCDVLFLNSRLFQLFT
jgi:hypothetical protein